MSRKLRERRRAALLGQSGPMAFTAPKLTPEQGRRLILKTSSELAAELTAQALEEVLGSEGTELPGVFGFNAALSLYGKGGKP